MSANDELTRISTRQTLVFLKTPDGWKIVHEHQSPKRHELANHPFPDAQAELRTVLQGIYNDAKTANLDGLRASHVNSDKFTKFGPRIFERQSVQQCNETEAAFFASIEDADFKLKDVKLDAFGEVAIATYYPHVSFKKDGRTVHGSGRQTLVFLKTSGGWKIIHEHGTPKACFE